MLGAQTSVTNEFPLCRTAKLHLVKSYERTFNLLTWPPSSLSDGTDWHESVSFDSPVEKVFLVEIYPSLPIFIWATGRL